MNSLTLVQYCWEQGGYLAEITSKEEEDLIDTFLTDGIHYWIGLTDIFVEGKSMQKLKIGDIFFKLRSVQMGGKP